MNSCSLFVALELSIIGVVHIIAGEDDSLGDAGSFLDDNGADNVQETSGLFCVESGIKLTGKDLSAAAHQT